MVNLYPVQFAGQPPHFALAQGVLRRNFRLDFTLGSWEKQRIGTRCANRPNQTALQALYHHFQCHPVHGVRRFIGHFAFSVMRIPFSSMVINFCLNNALIAILDTLADAEFLLNQCPANCCLTAGESLSVSSPLPVLLHSSLRLWRSPVATGLNSILPSSLMRLM